jgi:hypothetical protein
MNATRETAPTEVAAATLTGYPAFAWSVENELERLKNRLLREALSQEPAVWLVAPLRRAANEAAAIAWLEPHPLLVFPELFAEYVVRARNRHRKTNLDQVLGLVLLREAA